MIIRKKYLIIFIMKLFISEKQDTFSFATKSLNCSLDFHKKITLNKVYWFSFIFSEFSNSLMVSLFMSCINFSFWTFCQEIFYSNGFAAVLQMLWFSLDFLLQQIPFQNNSKHNTHIFSFSVFFWCMII
jgi:hypothetical protein